jgi:hypothetical protein
VEPVEEVAAEAALELAEDPLPLHATASPLVAATGITGDR